MYVLISSLPSSVYDKLYKGSMYYYAQAVIIKLSNSLSLSNNVSNVILLNCVISKLVILKKLLDDGKTV